MVTITRADICSSDVHGIVQVDRPAEALEVDDVDEDQREQQPERHAGHLADRAEHRGLGHDHRPHLPATRANRPQDAEFAPAFDHQRHQRADDAEQRDDDRDRLQRVGDRERAVEDAQDLFAQRAVGVDEDAGRAVEPLEQLRRGPRRRACPSFR